MALFWWFGLGFACLSSFVGWVCVDCDLVDGCLVCGLGWVVVEFGFVFNGDSVLGVCYVVCLRGLLAWWVVLVLFLVFGLVCGFECLVGIVTCVVLDGFTVGLIWLRLLT